MIKLSLTLLLLCSLCSAPLASADYAIYLVRHAEKTLDKKDPALTTCGTARALALVEEIAQAEKAQQAVTTISRIQHTYSTDYQRTLATARPSATFFGTHIETYDASDLPRIAKKLQAQAQSALVVGHSNTTSVLAGILAGQPQPLIDEREYDHLYVVTFTEKGVQLAQLQQKFSCEKNF